MGLQSFEHGVERMVEGVFSRAFKSSVRPIELGRRLVREMDEHRSLDVKGRRIVPNQYTFWLSPHDHAGFADIDEALMTELAEAAREYAREEDYHFLGPLVVELAVDNKLKPGRFGISSQIKDLAPAGANARIVLPNGDPVPLGQETATIGRLPECTVILADPNVSRRHAELRNVSGTWIISDLGSTNGVKLNGVRIDSEKPLRPGDMITIGVIHLRFETD
ncbi:MAG: DUF3662 and FHA domain-containing protein [Ilumatobacteraceae bacterium]